MLEEKQTMKKEIKWEDFILFFVLSIVSPFSSLLYPSSSFRFPLSTFFFSPFSNNTVVPTSYHFIFLTIFIFLSPFSLFYFVQPSSFLLTRSPSFLSILFYLVIFFSLDLLSCLLIIFTVHSLGISLNFTSQKNRKPYFCLHF